MGSYSYFWTNWLSKWNESGFRPPLCTYRLNCARRTSWGWWDDWDDTVLQIQDSKFEPWRSEAEHAASRSRRLPTILCFTRGWGRNIFVSFKPLRVFNIINAATALRMLWMLANAYKWACKRYKRRGACPNLDHCSIWTTWAYWSMFDIDASRDVLRLVFKLKSKSHVEYGVEITQKENVDKIIFIELIL